MSPTPGWVESRKARIRWPTCSVGSIEPEGIRYGLTTNAWIRNARPTATATVTISSITEYSGDFCFLDVRDAISASLRPVLGGADPVGRPIGEECVADHPRMGHRPPESAVERVGAIVAHHVVIALWHGERLRKPALAAAGARDRVAVRFAYAVAI